jgi:hypothetical protein
MLRRMLLCSKLLILLHDWIEGIVFLFLCTLYNHPFVCNITAQG